LDNGERRDFSMANPPRESDGAQLHIRHVPGGAFTSYVFETLKRGDRLKLEFPFGDFTLRESDKPILFVAGSTGFAPIRSIIEDMFIKNIRRAMTLLLGRADLERPLFRVAAPMGGAAPALQICAGHFRRARARHPAQPRAQGRAGGPSAAGRATRPMSAACR
jgi:ferredoxin-NADP reductase